MRALWMAVAVLYYSSGTQARRLQLSDSAFPFLATDAGALLRWSSGDMLEVLHYAQWIEVAPRGIRIGRTEPLMVDSTNIVKAQACEAIENALCTMPDGLLFPSPPPEQVAIVPPASPFPVVDPWVARLPLVAASSEDDNDEEDDLSVLVRRPNGTHSLEGMYAYYAGQTGGRSVPMTYALQGACALNGQGRELVPRRSRLLADDNNDPKAFFLQYTVTACDVLQGQLVAVYEPSTSTLRLLTQSFGPMPYCVALIQAAVCLYYATAVASANTLSKSGTQMAAGAALWLLSGCLLLGSGSPPFLTLSDVVHFWTWSTTGVLLAVGALATNDADRAAEACIYALGALADLAYRTPENAYGGLLCLALTVRQWQKLLRWRVEMAIEDATFTQRSGVGIIMLLDLAVTTPLLALSAELGAAPHCRYPERWPFYGGIGVYMGFIVAVHRLRHSSS